MRHFWIPLFLLFLLGPFTAITVAASSGKEPAVTILYTANTYGKQQPCPV
jgi:hypothetical protein